MTQKMIASSFRLHKNSFMFKTVKNVFVRLNDAFYYLCYLTVRSRIRKVSNNLEKLNEDVQQKKEWKRPCN